MTDAFNDWQGERAILDEILYRDPPTKLGRQLEVSNGVTRRVEVISFADGSSLAISAQVPLPPLSDMTPTRVTYLKLTGERGERWDDGSSEAMSLAGKSAAIRFLERVAKMIDEMPECEKVSCPSCSGGKYCIHCYGKGCPECSGTGICQECSGHGLIAKV